MSHITWYSFQFVGLIGLYTTHVNRFRDKVSFGVIGLGCSDRSAYSFVIYTTPCSTNQHSLQLLYATLRVRTLCSIQFRMCILLRNPSLCVYVARSRLAYYTLVHGNLTLSNAFSFSIICVFVWCLYKLNCIVCYYVFK